MADLRKGVIISQASTLHPSSWACSQVVSHPSFSTSSRPSERANEWPPETWKQQEMVPAVARLLHLCTGLWDTDEGRNKDQQSPEDATWNTINRSTDPESSDRHMMLAPEPLAPIGRPKTTPSPFTRDNVGSHSHTSEPIDGTGMTHAAPTPGSSMRSNLSTEAVAATSFSDKSKQGWDSVPTRGSSFQFVPFYGCAGKSKQPMAYSEAPTAKLRARSNVQELSDSEDECLLEEDDVEVLVGPTHLAVKPLRLEDQTLPHTCCDGSIVHMPLMSGPRCMILSEAMRLSNARSWQAPLSFGSVLHLNMGKKASCRPCMFERWAGRCTKSWLCDFCHLDVSERQLRVGKGSSKGSNRKQILDVQWCSFGKRPKSL